MASLPFGVRNRKMDVWTCGAPPGNGRIWGGVGGRRQRQLKVSGADNGHCVQGTGGALGGQSDTLAGMCQACLGMSAHDSPLLAPLWQAPSSGSPDTQNTVGQRSEPRTGEEKLRMRRAWQAFKVPHPNPENLSLLLESGRNNGKGHWICCAATWVGHFGDMLATLWDSGCPPVQMISDHSRVFQEPKHGIR